MKTLVAGFSPTSFAQKVGIDHVREADEMRIAQHFSAGLKSRICE